MPNFTVNIEFVSQKSKTFQVESVSEEKVRDQLLSQGSWVDFKGVLINLENVIWMEIKEETQTS
ncbi:hypothetical protein [Bacillus sp. V5-8f]|uniref:hypothetical protein n=1 Tax=Bacillus sp. V5-8f TaxID=2053044 RepID=UPI000C7604B2|nr:hypothetical protein [Bacillus sp. V5-8f]PLT32724.1 hypothetical protein CUU64_17605 [Bacillus sp. V5-8f]